MNLHNLLKRHAYQRLFMQGYKIGFEVPLDKGIGFIDVFGFKGLDKPKIKIGIECLTNPNDRIIGEKIKKYSPYFTKLIFCFFDDIEYKNDKINIWKFPRSKHIKIKHTMFEYRCNLCKYIFYTDNNIPKYCPYCKNDNIIQLYKCEDNKYLSISRCDKDNILKKPRNIAILKNPYMLKIYNPDKRKWQLIR